MLAFGSFPLYLGNTPVGTLELYIIVDIDAQNNHMILQCFPTIKILGWTAFMRNFIIYADYWLHHHHHHQRSLFFGRGQHHWYTMATFLPWGLLVWIITMNYYYFNINVIHQQACPPVHSTSAPIMSSPLLWGIFIGVWQGSEAQRLCLPNCQCTTYVADCTLSFCDEQYEMMVDVLILRGTMCQNQYNQLYALKGRTKIELHNARCTTLRNCE